MKIVIAGDGETGSHLAEMLSVENQDIILLGSNSDHLAELENTCNFITHLGSPTSVSDLMQCGVDKADIFIAVTPDENINILSCELAKQCGAGKCVARVDTPEFMEAKVKGMLLRLGLDLMIYPEQLAAEKIRHFINHNWVSEWFRICNGELNVVGVKISSEAPLCGKMLRDVSGVPRIFHVVAINRDGKIIIPRGDDMILEGDTVYFSVTSENITSLPELCGKSYTRVHKLMITGAGRITENLLRLIGSERHVTVIDPNARRCRDIALKFPKAVVVNSTSNDVNALNDEGISSCDMFLALTGSSEANIVSCMVAKQHGVPKTLARIEELQYIPEAESLAIDKIINKKRLNAGMVLNVILDTDETTSQCVSLDKAEITALVARDNSRIVSRPINELSLPHELTIGGIIRDGRGILVDGHTRIEPGDLVVVMFVSGALAKVRKLF